MCTRYCYYTDVVPRNNFYSSNSVIQKKLKMHFLRSSNAVNGMKSNYSKHGFFSCLIPDYIMSSTKPCKLSVLFRDYKHSCVQKSFISVILMAWRSFLDLCSQESFHLTVQNQVYASNETIFIVFIVVMELLSLLQDLTVNRKCNVIFRLLFIINPLSFWTFPS